jgi:hypothetical protein
MRRVFTADAAAEEGILQCLKALRRRVRVDRALIAYPFNEPGTGGDQPAIPALTAQFNPLPEPKRDGSAAHSGLPIE